MLETGDFDRIRRLFDRLVELPVGEREAELADIADASLRQRVARLLAAHEVRTSRATKLAEALPELMAATAEPEVGVGSTLGPWNLVGTLGSGGMGAVFLAERRDGHYDQRAAVKVLHGAPSATALALLAAERQILASLSHPHIARLLDGGATPRGQPYLVLEYVEGVALDQHVRDAGLSRDATLRLFLQVCAAVGFAHARLVVHCDLKPSNVLIDAAGRPVLLDFGIARLLGRSGDETAPRAYTPRYAAPELIVGESVGTAADIYSLGVVLGDLLEGRSERDLDAIVAKARAAAPADRYAAVAQLAADIERWLERRPVLARPPSLAYSATRLLQRRWPAFAAGAAFLATVAVLGGQLASQRNRALDAEAAAKREAAAAQAVSGFLTDLFHGADVDEGGARDATALSLVDRGRDRLEGELAAAPGTQAQLGGVLAGVYASLGEPQQAATLYARALELERAQRPPRPAQLARLLIDFSALELHRDRVAEAQPPAREALALVEANALSRPRDHIDALSALAAVDAQLGQFDDADKLLVRALALQEAEHDPDHVLAPTWYAQAQNAIERGDLDAALAKMIPTVAALRAHYGELHPRTLDAVEGLAVVYGRKERLDEAEKLLRDALAKRLQVHGERSSKVSSVQSELAYLLTQKGEYIESAALNRKVLEHDAAVQGRESPVYARTLNNLAFAYQNMGDAERCVASFKESLAIREKTLPAGDLAIARAQNNLARFLTWLGRTGESTPLVAAALAARAAQLPQGHEEVLESEVATMELSRRAGDLAGAHARWDRIEPLLAKAHPYTQLEGKRARAWLAASDRDADTRRYIAAYIDGLVAALGAKNPSVLRGRVAEAEMLEAFGDHAAAVALAKELRGKFSALPAAYPTTSIFFERLSRISP